MILNILLLFWNEILVRLFRFSLNKILNFFKKTRDLKAKNQIHIEKQNQIYIEKQNQICIENLKKLKQLFVSNPKIDDEDGEYKISKEASRLLCGVIDNPEWDAGFIANDIILKYRHVDLKEINKLLLIEFECSYFKFTFGNVVDLCKEINAELIKLGCTDLEITLDNK